MFRNATRSLVTALVLAAVIFPAGAYAKTTFSQPQTAAATSPPQVERVEVTSRSFRWRDAGIGAAAALTLLGAGAGTAAMTRRRRGQLAHPA